MDDFLTAKLGHVRGLPKSGSAIDRVLPKAGFENAIAEITAWQHYAPTPLNQLSALAGQLGVDQVFYKDEGPRFGLGSFKALGGSYAGLRVLQREISRKTQGDVSMLDIRTGKYRGACAEITLVSATDGNHGRSLAWGCQRFGAPCRIYIHAEVSEERAQAIRDFGADVIRVEGNYDVSVSQARDDAAQNGWFVVSDTSWAGYSEPPRDVMAGYGVMTQEICDALDAAPTHVFLQGGVGGLAASVVALLAYHWGDQSPRVVVVEPELAACLYESAKAGKVTNVDIQEETVMAGLSCGEPSEMAWEILDEQTSDFLTIPDHIVAPTVRLLARPLGDDPVIKAGESAVAGLAALIAAAQDPAVFAALGLNDQSRVLVIGTEGVTDQALFAAAMGGAL